MAVVSDDFNRANGSLGGSWADRAGTSSIAGGYAGSTSYSLTYHSGVTDQHILKVSIHSLRPTVTNSWAGPAVKIANSQLTSYYATVQYNNPGYTLVIVKEIDGGKTTLASQSLGSNIPPYYPLTLEWSYGTLTAVFNGATTLTAVDTQLSGNILGGFRSDGNTFFVDDITIVGGDLPSLSVSPTAIGNYGACVTVTLTGGNTNWTPGTPGSPTFTVDHGTISSQTVTSTTQATVTYCPGNYLGTVVFTDPSSGATASALVTSDPGIVLPPGAGGQLSTEAVAWIEAQAAHGGLVVAEQQSGSENGTEGVYLKGAFGELLFGKRYTVGDTLTPTPPTSLLQDIYARLWAGEDWQSVSFAAPGTNSLKLDADFLRSRWDSSVTPWTVEQVVAALAGDPQASHQDILTALDGLEVSTDLQPVLDAIAVLQGAEGATVDGAIQLIQALSTIAGYDLANVRDWVEAVRGAGQPDLAAVMTKLGQMQPSNAYTLSTLNTQGVDLKNLLDVLALVVGVVAPEAGTVAEVVSLIYDLVSAEAPPAANAGPPVWIDEEHATIDAPIALTDGLLLEGPMDGVIVTITGARAGAGKFAFGDVTSWRYCGAVVFGTDRGDWEWAQPIGLESQIVTCKTMQHASSALFRLESGFTGTAQPFTVTAGP